MLGSSLTSSPEVMASSHTDTSSCNADHDEAHDSHGLKLALVGNESVGKTSLWLRLGSEASNELVTCSLPCRSSTVMVNSVRVQLWDTSAKERCPTLACCECCQGILVVYDITHRQTFYAVPFWMRDLREHLREHVRPEPVMIIVGNKSDKVQSREVSYEEGYNLAAGLALPFLETCALDGTGVQESIDMACKSVLADMHAPGRKEGFGVSMPNMSYSYSVRDFKLVIAGISGEVMLELGDAVPTTSVADVLHMILARMQSPRVIQLCLGTRVLRESATLEEYMLPGQRVLELTCLKLQALKLAADIQDAESVNMKLIFSILGDTAVGKTCLKNQFAPSSPEFAGADDEPCIISLGDRKLLLQILDAGLVNMRAQDCSARCAVLIVYDVTRKHTFYHVPHWIYQARSESDVAPAITLVGNKSDKIEHRQVSYEEGLNLATGLGIPFLETSASSGQGVSDAFLTTCEHAWRLGFIPLTVADGG